MASYGTVKDDPLLSKPPPVSNVMNVDDVKSDPANMGSDYQGYQLNESKDNDEDDDNTVELMSGLVRFTRIVAPCYLGLGACSLVLLIIGLLSILDQIIGIFIIFVGTIVGALAGAYGIYKWGTVQMEIGRLSRENDAYDSEINQLKTIVGRTKNEVNQIDQSVTDLRQDADVLHENLSKFDELREQLNDIAKDNEDVLGMITNLNTMFDDLKSVERENEKSQLYSMYYDVEMSDNSAGLSERDYKRLLARLPKHQRSYFQELGTFKELAGHDNVIDLKEFQSIVSRFLDQIDQQQLPNTVG